MLVRSDLPLADQMVQACHASLEVGHIFAQPKESTYIALLSVPEQKELLLWRNRLAEVGIRSFVFYEPDPIISGDTEAMGYTALATEPIAVSDPRRKVLRRLALWGAKP